jgi:hypothetical protein
MIGIECCDSSCLVKKTSLAKSFSLSLALWFCPFTSLVSLPIPIPESFPVYPPQPTADRGRYKIIFDIRAAERRKGDMSGVWEGFTW